MLLKMYTLKAKIFLVKTLQSTESLILYFFAHENMEKKMTVGYFSKMANIFTNTL